MRIIMNSALLAVAVFAVACSKNEALTVPSNEWTPVHFSMTVNGVGTKTVTEANGMGRTVSWREGDAAGIFVDDETAAHRYLFTETEGWTSADAVYALEGQSYSFYTWYPYDSEIVKPVCASSLEASVLSNQNNQYGGNSGFDISDVLIANKENVTVSAIENVELQYSHAFAMVEVLVSGTKVTDAPKSVTLNNIVRTATIDLKTKSVALKDGEAVGNVVMYKVEPVAEDAKGYLYRAVVPAQSIPAGEALLELVIADKTYCFKAPATSAVAYEAGRYRRIEAVAGDAEGGLSVKFPAGSVDVWSPSENLPDGGGEEVENVVNLVRIKISDLTAETFMNVGNANSYLQDPNNANYIKETSWVMSTYNNQNIAGELVEEDGAKAIRLYSEDGIAFGWFNSGIRYHHVGDYEPGYYRLDVIMKRSADSSSRNLSVFIRTSKTTAHDWGNGLFFSIKKDDGNYTQRISTGNVDAEWITSSVYFDFNQAYSTANTPGANDYFEVVSDDREAYCWFDIALMPNGGGKQDFYIRDVELIKISHEDFEARK